MPAFLLQFIRHYLLSLQFFTRIPVTGRLAQWVGFSPAMLRASAGHFPGVGVLVGALVAVFSGGLAMALPHTGAAALVVAVLGTALGVLITGAFHEDGLADVADGLGGSVDRDRALVIMKDSRVGAFGAIAVVLVLLSKVALLALLGDISVPLLCTALFAAHVVSRTWPLLTIRLLAHVGDAAGSKSKPLADQISGAALLTGFLWCFWALAIIVYAQAATMFIAFDLALDGLLLALLNALVLSAIAWGWMTRWFWQRLGGFTGDCLGATQQVCEVAFYLGLGLSL
ncbi:MAG: adenosylcobinamide-GDP ribazoletransferase [Rhodoferax sp.]|jgi:adenosylcobinamide-GDP ribazoletransferase|uniref:adenosylcobinamide-GDP ribazoletransferase n=1 Tax=Rhodoferax sp. TaxID=50421 RepID=UPI001B5BCFCC|nr:adenosylcobinamide-GDP ribazoletransferase [Rhodoferax sp.]MBP9148043.1 adenosylcobinamide-GDP ribazoletransferase [Rhodoferax sp.]MBP9735969.1 adenosylcobinamide-GDP ribazoletransferase [Rhodoferax sp.]